MESVQEKTKEYERYLIRDHRLNLIPEVETKLKRYEVPKSTEETQLFEYADSWSRARQEICEVPGYTFPVQNIFLLSKEGFRAMTGSRSDGVAHTELQRIVAIARSNTFILTGVVMHEMMHCKGKIVIELIQQGDSLHENTLRRGLGVLSPHKRNQAGEHHVHLGGLEEAVVAQEEVYFYSDLLKRPEFRDLKEQMGSGDGRQERKNILAQERLDEDDLAWFDSKSRKYEVVGYPLQRRVLRYMCQEIALATRSTDNEVYFQFLKSHFTGHLLEVARAVEETFGKGSFRRLGDMGTDKGSAVQTLEALKKMRMNMLKDSKK